jgi:hypothetical protein
MRNVYQIDLRPCEENNHWYNKLFDEPRFDVILSKEDEEIGVIGYRKNYLEALEIQLAAMTTFMYTSRYEARNKKELDQESAHRAVMDKCDKMTSDEKRQSLINAGIITADNKLTKPYFDLAMELKNDA